ncbi:MAG: peptide chain release factor 1 [Candidatus Omnitrophica bacterium]|jgi:peptide chain release factor 1|nr:peptide chain release factor 1 [Candidatus Omnitrophota bacterium]
MFKQLEKADKRYQEIEALLGQNDVANNQSQYQKLAKELASIRPQVELFRQYKQADQEIRDLESELAKQHDKDFIDLVKKELPVLVEKKNMIVQQLEKQLVEEDKDLNRGIIMEIRQGTGGMEAALFAADLYRMYSQYAAQKGWVVELLSSHPTELGGFKEVVFSVQGDHCYKRLRFESGVHRVQRVPETESQGRVHTSTATVAVLVEPEEVDLVIEPKDLKIDTYRSSGPGGQHMQKTDSAVRITHIPTGVVVACQDERSQIKNKAKAMRVLGAKILDMKQQADSKKVADERRSQVGTGDRSEKIRTYNYPDRRVTDHRINLTLYRLEAILNGDLEELSDAIIKASQEKQREAKNE